MQDVILLESYGIPWKTKYQLRLGSRNVFRKLVLNLQIQVHFLGLNTEW